MEMIEEVIKERRSAGGVMNRSQISFKSAGGIKGLLQLVNIK